MKTKKTVKVQRDYQCPFCDEPPRTTAQGVASHVYRTHRKLFDRYKKMLEKGEIAILPWFDPDFKKNVNLNRAVEPIEVPIEPPIVIPASVEDEDWLTSVERALKNATDKIKTLKIRLQEFRDLEQQISLVSKEINILEETRDRLKKMRKTHGSQEGPERTQEDVLGPLQNVQH